MASNALNDHLQIKRLERFRQRLGSGGLKAVSLQSAEVAQATVTATLDNPIDFIEVPAIKAARLPLGPTRAHLDGMIQAGKLDAKNVFDTKALWKTAEINPEAPQVFGYTIESDEELVRVITDAKVLAEVRKEIETTGSFPTIYTMNHPMRVAHAAYLGGRLATQEEQKAFWDKIPGSSILEKATSASIPFTGYFHAGNRGFNCVGEWSWLLSASPCGSGHSSLDLSRGGREAVEDWHDPKRGFSSLVVFG